MQQQGVAEDLDPLRYAPGHRQQLRPRLLRPALYEKGRRLPALLPDAGSGRARAVYQCHDTRFAAIKQRFCGQTVRLPPTMENVIKTTVFLKDMNDFAAMNEVYAGFFPGNPPARNSP